MTENNKIDTIEFHGDIFQAVHDGNKIWVPIKPICSILGIDHTSQRRKLQTAPWAVGVEIPSTGSDGKSYDMYCLEHRKLPMWLVNIHVAKVNEASRPKLTLFQNEVADYLADLYFGPRETEIDILKKKAYDLAVDPGASYPVRRFAALLNISYHDLIHCLRAANLVYKPLREDPQPKIKALDKGWMSYKLYNGSFKLFITGRGVLPITDIWEKYRASIKDEALEEFKLRTGLKKLPFPKKKEE